MNTAVNTHLYFPADLYAELSLVAREEGVPVAKIVREFVSKGLKTNKKLKKVKKANPLDWLLSFHLKGPVDGSINHDKYLYD